MIMNEYIVKIIFENVIPNSIWPCISLNFFLRKKVTIIDKDINKDGIAYIYIFNFIIIITITEKKDTFKNCNCSWHL